MRIKAISLAIFSLLGFFSHCHANPVGASNWRVIWFPPSDTFRSWNWVEISGHNDNTMKIRPIDYNQKFPDEVKQWELGVTSINDPGKKAAIPLGNPHSSAENFTDYSVWMPGSKIDRLEALGEGTFLCAILGDGKRYSNVARVTIRHDYNTSREPVIRLVAVQPFGKDDPIRYIGAWIVAPTPADLHFTTTAVRCPVWEVNGTWRIALGDLNGLVAPLPSGISWGEVYYVGFGPEIPPSEPVEFSTYEPPIEAFTDAKVRLRISDRYNTYDGIPLTTGQHEYLFRYQLDNFLFDNSEPSADFKTYISDVFDVRVDKDAMSRFDKAFDQ
jgi:hypothetical protein